MRSAGAPRGSSDQEGALSRTWTGKGRNAGQSAVGRNGPKGPQAQGFGGEKALLHAGDNPRSQTARPRPEPHPLHCHLPSPSGALTGRHQFQEECLLRAVPLPKLPHYVAFPAGDGGAEGAGPLHGSSRARRALSSCGRRRNLGGASVTP